MGILEGHSFSDAFVLRWFMKEPCWRAENSCGVVARIAEQIGRDRLDGQNAEEDGSGE
jgi:hypothetical protein